MPWFFYLSKFYYKILVFYKINMLGKKHNYSHEIAVFFQEWRKTPGKFSDWVLFSSLSN